MQKTNARKNHEAMMSLTRRSRPSEKLLDRMKQQKVEKEMMMTELELDDEALIRKMRACHNFRCEGDVEAH
eukprot:2605567-Pleurochrysis_carterae.AAC.1